MHVGLPCMKLSLSPSNQKHHGKAARTCSAKDAWAEMNDERRGRDTTIDRSMTYQNVWLTGNTEMDMTAEIQKQIDRVNEDKRVHGKRALRFDAVTGIEMIEKPPMEYMEKLSREKQIRFLKDSGVVMDSILKEWNPEWITAAQVLHFDEFGGRAPHSHRIVIPVTKDKDNILSFNAKAEFNLKFFTFVNKEYPKRMRERGYEVEDCKIYEEMTEEQKLEHQKDKPDYGLESMDFKRKKSEELDQRISEKESMLADKQQELEGLTKDQQAVKTENRKLKEENREIKAEILSKKQIEAMPMPPKTLKGDFKVSPDQYRNLVATAKRVDMVLDKEKAISRKETKLREERTRLEAERKLPIKEQMELFKLRTLKNVVEKVTKILPEGWIKRVLLAALAGRDVMDQERNKTMSVAERSANARRADREAI